VDVWTGLLAVRRLVLSPQEDVIVYLKYATMCRKEGKEQQSWRTLTKLLGYDPMQARASAAACDLDILAQFCVKLASFTAASQAGVQRCVGAV
jgi:FAT domain